MMDTKLEAQRRVIAERERQITIEGWTPEHDDTHCDGEMAIAAAVYALMESGLNDDQFDFEELADLWPWDYCWLKTGDPIRNLEKAGALILAELERRLRKSVQDCDSDTPPKEGA